jgi:hypothetical protein
MRQLLFRPQQIIPIQADEILRNRRSSSPRSTPPAISSLLFNERHSEAMNSSSPNVRTPLSQMSNTSPSKSSLESVSPQKLDPFSPDDPHHRTISRIWTQLTSPFHSVPKSSLRLTWHLQNPTSFPWKPPIVLSMLLCKSSAASAMLGAWTDNSGPSGEQILLRTKGDLRAHEGRYEYLMETVSAPVMSGEMVEVTAEIAVPEIPGCYWGCFKVARESEELYCAFKSFQLGTPR